MPSWFRSSSSRRAKLPPFDLDFVHEVTYENFSQEWLEMRKFSFHFRVLSLVKCPSINEGLDKFLQAARDASIRESPFFFVLSIDVETKNLNETKTNPKIKNSDIASLVQRPFVVMLSETDNGTSSTVIVNEKTALWYKLEGKRK